MEIKELGLFECPTCKQALKIKENLYSRENMLKSNYQYSDFPVCIWICSKCRIEFIEIIKEGEYGSTNPTTA